MVGIFEGDICGRNGCNGVIALLETDGCCSCHINPPCGYCTTPREYCPECDWEASGELKCSNLNGFHVRYVPKTNIYVGWKRRELDKTKIDYHILSHTNSSQICEGVYPDGTTMGEVERIVAGTFGGRFEYFGNGKFKYIAYTD